LLGHHGVESFARDDPQSTCIDAHLREFVVQGL
jgi:hypothetical protein